MIDISILILTGLIAGTLGSAAGLGGALVILPILEMGFHYEIPIAMGTALLAVAFTSVSSLYAHNKMGSVNWKMGIPLGISGIIGVLAGSVIFKVYLEPHVRVVIFFLGIWFWLMSFRMGKQIYLAKKEIKNGKISDENNDKKKISFLAVIVLGVVTGLMAGILGIGGGAIMTAVMTALMGIAPRIAVGTSFAAMLPLSLTGGLFKVYQGYVNLKSGLLLGFGTMVGAQLGAYLLKIMSPLTVKAIFTVIFTLLGAKYIFIG